jgi:hypothetical protein
MKRTIDRAFQFEHVVGTFRRRDLVRGDALQREHDMNPPEHEDALVDLDFAVCHGFESISACRDLARLQRAAQGTEQSATGRSDHIIDCGRMRIGHLARDAVVTRDRPMRAKTYGVGLGRKLRETERALDSSQRDLRSIDDVSHGYLSSEVRLKPDTTYPAKAGHYVPG